MLRPGFEPGSLPREGKMIGYPILYTLQDEAQKITGLHYRSNIMNEFLGGIYIFMFSRDKEKKDGPAGTFIKFFFIQGKTRKTIFFRGAHEVTPHFIVFPRFFPPWKKLILNPGPLALLELLPTGSYKTSALIA
jgi:hypothetical protein